VRGPAQKIEVKCPRCGGDAGVVYGWIETSYSAEYDEKTKADKGKVVVEVKVDDTMIRNQTYATSTEWLEHTCPTGKEIPVVEPRLASDITAENTVLPVAGEILVSVGNRVEVDGEQMGVSRVASGGTGMTYLHVIRAVRPKIDVARPHLTDATVSVVT